MTDERTIEITRVLCALRSVLGLEADAPACMRLAFSVTDADLQRLHDVVGKAIRAAERNPKRKATRLKRF